MHEQRKHQRIRFSSPPVVRLGQSGVSGSGRLENLSPVGLSLHTDLALKVGEGVGCEFSVFGSPVIDLSGTVASRVGQIFGVRFEAGPVTSWIIREAINAGLASGNASVLSINDLQGRKVMRIVGGLNRCLRSDVMHGLVKVGVQVLDMSGVTDVDEAGLDLCRIAATQHKVELLNPPVRVSNAVLQWVCKGRAA